MERTFFPSRVYWIGFWLCFTTFGADLICIFVLGFVTEDSPLRRPPENPARPGDLVAFWCLTTFFVVGMSVGTVYAVLAYRRTRLVIREDEVRSYGALLVRVIRFAEVVAARWLWRSDRWYPHGVRLRTARRELVIYFDIFLPGGAQGELVDWFRARLGPGVQQNWDTFQAVREGRASPWSPQVFTFKRIWRMLAVVTGLSVIVGAALGLLLRIRTPGAAEWWVGATGSGEINSVIKIPGASKWPWSGSLLWDWSLICGVGGLVGGVLFLSFSRFCEWVDLKWRTLQGRRPERTVFQPAHRPFQPPPDSSGG